MRIFAALVLVALSGGAFMHGQQHATPAPVFPPGIEPERVRATATWEYAVYSVGTDAGLQALLTDRGLLGWEAFSIRQASNGKGLEVVFKRPGTIPLSRR